MIFMFMKMKDKIIKCPFCEEELTARFILEKKGQMSRFYAYCKKDKCSVMKSVKRADE